MLAKTKAIVIHTLKYGDQKLIIDMLTEDFGRLTFASKIPKTQHGKLKKQFFQPLTLLNIEIDHKPNKEMQQLRDASILTPLTNIPFDANKLSISLFLSEFIMYATRGEREANPALFEYIKESMLWLDTAGDRFANFHLVFMMRLTRFIGFAPNVEGYERGCMFDLRQGLFIQTLPEHKDFLKPADAEKMSIIIRMNYGNMHLFKMTRDERNQILEVLIAYYRLHVPGFPEMKSLSVLKELF